MVRITDFATGKRKGDAEDVQQIATYRFIYGERSIGDPVIQRLLHMYDELMRDIELSKERAKLIKTTSFNLNIWTEEGAMRDFRFIKSDIVKVCKIFDWPRERTHTQRCRYKMEPLEATAVVLYRLATTSRWTEAEEVFGRTAPAMSEIFHQMVEHVSTTKFHLIRNFQCRMMERKAQLYAERIEAVGAPLSHCVGFFDGTTIEIARPMRDQGVCYSGHKRYHCLKFQTICTPTD